MAAEDLLTNKNRAGIGHVTKTYFCNLQCVSSPPNTMSRIPINGVSLDVIYHKDFIGMLGSIIHGLSSISSPLLCRGRIWDMSLPYITFHFSQGKNSLSNTQSRIEHFSSKLKELL